MNTDVLAEERRIMDMYAPHYRSATLTNSYPYQLERRRFAEWVVATAQEDGRPTEGRSVLDVGCGTGEILQHLAELGLTQLTGIDASPRMIEEARRHVPGARFQETDIAEWNSGDAHFDMVTAAFTVHHLAEPRAFFELVDTVLAPGGSFFLLEYNMASWSHRRPLSKALALPVIPLRWALKLKNRAALARLYDLPAVFNPAHRQLTYEELIAAMPHPERYAMRRRTHGLWLPTLKNALIGSAAIDRAIVRGLEAIERQTVTRDAGHFQWVAGRKL